MRAYIADGALARQIRQEILDVLVGAHEIAERAGVTFSAVVKWQSRHEDFPKPVRTLTMGKMWLWPEVEAWLRKRGRIPA